MRVAVPSMRQQIWKLDQKTSFHPFYKRTMPVGKDIFWMMETGTGFGSSSECGFFISDGQGNYTNVKKTNMRRSRGRPALINMKSKLIFACGGFMNRTAEKYDIEKDQWRLISPLNYSREGCDGVSVNDNIYVFCGYDAAKNKERNSVEVLNTSLLGKPGAAWQLCKLDDEFYSNRVLSLVPISDSEIVIFAIPHYAFRSNFEHEEQQGKACISFNTQTMQSKRLRFDFGEERDIKHVFQFKGRSLLMLTTDEYNEELLL